jgi:lysophospholipase L1-like esterase
MMTGFITTITTQALALALLAAPVFAANENNYTYLALGDSVAFGYDPTITAPAPAKFTGYPEIVAEIEHLLKSKREVNAACPGETSSSFWISGALDNGCNGRGPQGQPPFKTSIGLHTNYIGTQLQFAVSQLTSNKHINLVTLGIGGNDLLLIEQRCLNPLPFPTFADCVGANLPDVLKLYGQNIAQILTALRVQAKYDGTLILVKQYSPSVDPLFTQVVGAMNQVLMQVGAPFGAKFADGFTAFQLASAFFQGDPCKAGLLIHLTSTTCDVHPAPLGRNVLAATIVFAIGNKGM